MRWASGARLAVWVLVLPLVGGAIAEDASPPTRPAAAPTAPASSATTTTVPAPAAEAEPAEERVIPWGEADQHVGETITVEGRVVDVHCSPLTCLLAFEPSFNKFTAAIPADRFKMFPPDDLEERFVGKPVRVHGTIVDLGNKPEIVVTSPDALRVTRGERRREREERRDQQATAQAEAMDRLSDAVARVEDLTARLA